MDSDSFTASGSKPAPFLQKLYRVVDDPENHFAVSWTNHGLNFLVSNAELFATQVLPVYFKHNNFSSFVRQLNMYGFRKISKKRSIVVLGESHAWEFSHPHFLKGHPEELVHITRKPKPSQIAAEKSPTAKTTSVKREDADSYDIETPSSVSHHGAGESKALAHELEDLQAQKQDLEDSLRQCEEEKQILATTYASRLRAQQVSAHKLLDIISRHVNMMSLQSGEKEAITEALYLSRQHQELAADNASNSPASDFNMALKPLDMTSLVRSPSSGSSSAASTASAQMSDWNSIAFGGSISPSVILGEVDYWMTNTPHMSGPFVSEVDESLSHTPQSLHASTSMVTSNGSSGSSAPSPSSTTGGKPLRRSPRRQRASSITIQEVFGDDASDNNNNNSSSSSSTSSSTGPAATDSSNSSDSSDSNGGRSDISTSNAFSIDSAMSYLAISTPKSILYAQALRRDAQQSSSASLPSASLQLGADDSLFGTSDSSLLTSSMSLPSFDSSLDPSALGGNQLELEEILALEDENMDSMFHSVPRSPSPACKPAAINGASRTKMSVPRSPLITTFA